MKEDGSMTKTIKERFEKQFFIIETDFVDGDSIFMFDKNEITDDKVYALIEEFEELYDNEEISCSIDDFFDERKINYYNMTHDLQQA